MNKLTNLILQYQQNNSKDILKEILNTLDPIIIKKAKYVYYVKWYPINLYHFCKYCRNCNKLNNIPKSEQKSICQECEICTCEKGFFNLNKNRLCDYEDVYQDLYLTILQMIKKFQPEKDFENYFYNYLWEWMPSFVTKNFIKSLSHKSLIKIDEEGNETQIDIPEEEKQTKQIDLDSILKLCKTERKKKIVRLLAKGLKQEEIAETLKVSPQYISNVLKGLRDKLKILVDF